MNKKLLIAALIAPSLALSFNPASARSKHHRPYSQHTYGSGKAAPSNKSVPSGQGSSSQEGGAKSSPGAGGSIQPRDRSQDI
ncbi:MAG: hypothetical protein ACR650_17210 [Methylocystis sp.]|jgi:hypothetical protein